MPAQDQTMVHAFGLGIIERWQVGECGRGGVVENGFGEVLQGCPARPFERWGMGDLTQQAAPFDDHAINVAHPDDVVDPAVFG